MASHEDRTQEEKEEEIKMLITINFNSINDSIMAINQVRDSWTPTGPTNSDHVWLESVMTSGTEPRASKIQDGEDVYVLRCPVLNLNP